MSDSKENYDSKVLNEKKVMSGYPIANKDIRRYSISFRKMQIKNYNEILSLARMTDFTECRLR